MGKRQSQGVMPHIVLVNDFSSFWRIRDNLRTLWTTNANNPMLSHEVKCCETKTLKTSPLQIKDYPSQTLNSNTTSVGDVRKLKFDLVMLQHQPLSTERNENN